MQVLVSNESPLFSKPKKHKQCEVMESESQTARLVPMLNEGVRGGDEGG